MQFLTAIKESEDKQQLANMYTMCRAERSFVLAATLSVPAQQFSAVVDLSTASQPGVSGLGRFWARCQRHLTALCSSAAPQPLSPPGPCMRHSTGPLHTGPGRKIA